MINIKKIATAATLAIISTVMVSGAASAGEWRLDARSCPDLREDRRDARHYDGRWDVREDRRDQQVIDCPPRSWTYVASRYEQRNGFERGSGVRRGTPGLVYTSRQGDFYRVNRRGERQWINVVIDYPRYNNGQRYQRYTRHNRHDYRDRRHQRRESRPSRRHRSQRH